MTHDTPPFDRDSGNDTDAPGQTAALCCSTNKTSENVLIPPSIEPSLSVDDDDDDEFDFDGDDGDDGDDGNDGDDGDDDDADAPDSDADTLWEEEGENEPYLDDEDEDDDLLIDAEEESNDPLFLNDEKDDDTDQSNEADNF